MSEPLSNPSSPADRAKKKAEAALRMLIDRVANSLSGTCGEQLGKRLRFLCDEWKEEEPIRVPSVASLSNLVAFLEMHLEMRCPDVALTPDGNFRAEWHDTDDRHFAVTFLPTGEVRFVVFANVPGDADRVDRVSGTTTHSRLLTVIEPFAVSRWTHA